MERENEIPSMGGQDFSPTPVKEKCILNITLATNVEGWNITTNDQLVTELAKNPRVKVYGLVPSSSQEQKDQAKKSNIELVDAKKFIGFSEKNDFAFPPDDLDIDILIIHSYDDLGKQAQIIKETKKCKWLHVVHTISEEIEKYNLHKGDPKWLNEHKVQLDFCQEADIIIAIGPKVADAYRSAMYFRGKDKDVINLTPEIVYDLLNVRPMRDDGEIFRVMISATYPAKYFKVKGCDVAAKAITLLQDMSYHLIFVVLPGDNDEDLKTKLDGFISLSQFTVKHVSRSTEDWKKLLCYVDLAIMPSAEGFGTSSLRAISANLPVLSSGNSGFGMALKKLPSGGKHVLDSEDPQVWADKIKEIRQKGPEKRALEARQLQTEYMEKYSWKDQCDKLVDEMIKMLPSKGDIENLLQQIQQAAGKGFENLKQKKSNFTDAPAGPSRENRGNKDQRDEKDNINSDIKNLLQQIQQAAGKGFENLKLPEPKNKGNVPSESDYKSIDPLQSGHRGEETGSRLPERIQQDSFVKDTIACNINVMDNLALLLDKASFIRNREVPLTKNWVNLAEYFEVSEDVRLRCQHFSPNSPAKNLFEFLRTRSVPVKRVTDCLREIGRTDLANMLEPLCVPGNAELPNLFDNPNHSKILDKICLHLDGGGIGNWQELGKQIGIQVKELTDAKMLQFAKETHGCTEVVLGVIEKKTYPEVTVGKIKEVLTSLGREDVFPALNCFRDDEGISTLLDDLDAMEKITTLLDNETPGVNSWPQFAQKFGLTRKECDALRPDGPGSPTKELITHLIHVRPSLTVKEFIAAIQNIGRLNDVTKVLKEFFNAECVDRIVFTVMREMEKTI